MTKPRFIPALCAIFFLSSGLSAQESVQKPEPGRPPADGTIRLPPAVIDDTLAITGEEIEAQRLGTRLTVEVRVNGKGPYRFVVDSGADTSVVGQRIATALSLPTAGTVLLNGITGSAMVGRVSVDTLALGNQSIHDLELPALHEFNLGAQGLIGLDALVEQRIELDFENRKVTIDDAKRPPPRYVNEIVVTARRQHGQLILTQATANGQAVDAVIDTGSQVTIGNAAMRERLFGRRNKPLDRTIITGVTGTEVEVEYAVVPRLKLGPIVLENVPVAFADVPPFAVFGLTEKPALLLGTDLMANFRKVSLDFRARRVRFQLVRCDVTRPRLTMSVTRGARLFAEEDSPLACQR